VNILNNMNKKIVLLLLPFIFLSSCSTDNNGEDETRDYSDYSSHQTTLDEFYSKEGRYCIYFYQLSCSHCTAIKGDIFDYIDAQDKGEKTYFKSFSIYCLGPKPSDGTLGNERSLFDYKGTKYSDEEVASFVKEMQKNEVNTLAKTYLFGTPSLYIINNNKFEDLMYGQFDIANFLSTH